jgi:arginine-tRNA-protein transferase
MIFLDDGFHARRVQPGEMDLLWANGWRHFGVYFFRYSLAEHHRRICNVMPLRIELSRFTPSRSQKRYPGKEPGRARSSSAILLLMRRKKPCSSAIANASKRTCPTRSILFCQYQPASVPCRNQEICVYAGERLLAASFLDIGEEATSAVYATFEPEKHKRSLGIFTCCARLNTLAS